MIRRLLPGLIAISIVLVLVITALTRPEPEIVLPLADASEIGMTFPQNYREEFERYLVVDRIDDTVRHIYAHPDAVAALRAGEDIPYGTQLVIETWDVQRTLTGAPRRDASGHLVPGQMRPNIHVMEKQPDWTIEQLPSPVGVIDWNFASFDAETMRPSMENRNDCLTCHDGGAFRRDFLFSRFILEEFANSGESQYLFCRLPERGNCIR